MQKIARERWWHWAAFALPFLSIAVHLAPFLLYGKNPLGYDTGFYRRYLTQPFHAIPNDAVPGLGGDALVPRIALDVLRLLHLPADVLLYGSYLALFALLPVLFFYFLRPTFGERGAWMAGFFIALSPVSYNAYYYLLFKNAFALDLMIFAFIALERRWLRLALVLDVAIALSHTTSAILYLCTLGVLFVLWGGRRKEIAGHGALTFALFALVNASLAHQVRLALPVALFIEWPQYLWLSTPLLIITACGWRAFVGREALPRTLVAFAVASFAFPILHLPFYQRMFVFSDVALSAFAAYAASYLFARIDIREFPSTIYVPIFALSIGFGLLLGNVYDQIKSLSPLLPESSIQRIEAVGKVVPEGALILTSANEAPWYEGWTQAHIAAPGLLHDTHNLEAWEALWSATSTDGQIRFLASFPQPLYISTTGSFQELIGNPAPCLKKVAPDLLLDACK